jgi:hypothetical protein
MPTATTPAIEKKDETDGSAFPLPPTVRTAVWPVAGATPEYVTVTEHAFFGPGGPAGGFGLGAGGGGEQESAPITKEAVDGLFASPTASGGSGLPSE